MGSFLLTKVIKLINFSKVRFLRGTLYIAVIIICGGCGGLINRGADDGLQSELRGEMARLKESLSEIDLEIEELRNKFLLLQEKVEANREELRKLGSEHTTLVPPEGLKVVKLGEEAAEEDIETLEPESLYSHGQDLFMSGRYREARDVFSRFVEKFPEHSLADNALYWIGETYYTEQSYTSALERFLEVVERYPAENKAPDALLKVAYSYIELGEKRKARTYLERLITQYPESGAADKARKRLKEL